MRPIRLELKGFTAFRDEQTIEFDGLDLFAISGPTGSGKTSILDAITYALYGTIERVGKQAAQFVSQGQKRMSVLLEFAVGDERYQIARSTPVNGATKIMLERWTGDEWQQVGEGADRVTGANAIIRDALGLDYESFTRTVLLPQGTFAQFLSGDAKERRAILTDLLGLELFERLGRRSGELKREAESEIRAKTTVLETEYGGVTPEAEREASKRVDELAAREDELARTEKNVRELARRGAEAARSVRELVASADEVRGAALVAASAAVTLGDLGAQLSEADARAKEVSKDLRVAEKGAEKARSALANAQTDWGGARELERHRSTAIRAAEVRKRLEEAQADLRAARQAEPKLEKVFALTEQALAVATADAEAAILAVESARDTRHVAEHADMAATLRSELHAGDDCPVCGRELERMPKAKRAPMLEKAKAEVARAEVVAKNAAEELDRAKAVRDAAGRGRADAERARAASEKTVAELTKDLAGISGQLASVFGPKVSADPIDAIDDRLERLEELEAMSDAADAAAAEAKEATIAAERERAALDARSAEIRGRLEGIAVTGIADRARIAGGSDLAVDELPRVERVKDTAALTAAAGALADALSALGERLLELSQRRSKAEDALLAEMHAGVDGLVDPAESLTAQVEVLVEARTAAGRTLAAAEHRVSDLRTKLQNAEKLGAEIAEQRERLARFDALAKELRADHVISFLQAEALQMLAAAGSDRLAMLSSGRYHLAFAEDEFFVVDTWNGEEQRSVRTLSGGETFLASLALALALSEQVRSLSVSDRARLDSLFLDEGFGTLDPESLEVVVDAIEQLGGDGRMVGVITHVQELAIRLPARIEVEKSPRGSRLKVVAAD